MIVSYVKRFIVKYRTLGKNGPLVSALGLGCMGLSEFYGGTENTDRNAGITVIQEAYSNGITLFDTADMYAMGDNEKLLGEAIKSFRDQVIIATKCGIERDATKAVINNTPAYIKKACDASLARLGVQTIDVYFLHRYNPEMSLEDAMQAMMELIEEKKIKYVGLSEVSADTLQRAHVLLGDKLVAVQSEFSLINHATAEIILPLCKKLGLAFVCYSPLARGLLSGRLKSAKTFSESKSFDYRSTLPQFSAENLPYNLAFVEALEKFVQKKQCTVAQLALAWLLAQGDAVIPIPGASHVEHLKENTGAVDIILTPDDLNAIQELMKKYPIKGARYPHDEQFITWDRKSNK